MTPKGLFGLENVFYRKENNSNFTNLSQEIRINGFSDYSKYGISSFLSFRYPVLHHTMFNDIYKKEQDYSNDKENEIFLEFSTRTIELEKALQTAELLLLDSIKNKVGRAQRIGVLLSGGLDSSLLCAMCKKLFPTREIYTYSAGFYGDDEFEYSDTIVKLLNTKHYKKILSSTDFFGEDSLLPSLIKQKGYPLHPNELPLALLEAKARLDCCDVILCGEGADDIFGGYSNNLAMYLDYKGDNTHFYQKIMQEYRYFTAQKAQMLIKEKYLISDCEIIKSIFQSKKLPDNTHDIMLYFIQMLHTRGLIERGMNALQYNGFDEGFVFLDAKLINFINTLPFDFKLACKENLNKTTKIQKVKDTNYKTFSNTYLESKFLLKEIAKNYLPYNIIYRTKKGFPVPFELWDKEKPLNFTPNNNIFKTDDLSMLNGWEKFMIYNLNMFFNIFDSYKMGGGGVTLTIFTFTPISPIFYRILSFFLSNFSINFFALVCKYFALSQIHKFYKTQSLITTSNTSLHKQRR